MIEAIHKFLVKPGKTDKVHGKNLNRLFELRSIGDYGDFRHMPQQDAAKAIAVAQSFVKGVIKLMHCLEQKKEHIRTWLLKVLGGPEYELSFP